MTETMSFVFLKSLTFCLALLSLSVHPPPDSRLPLRPSFNAHYHDYVGSLSINLKALIKLTACRFSVAELGDFDQI